MVLVVVGVLMIVMNLAGIGWFAAWNWELTGDLWKFCAPFALAALWWFWSDKSGLNKRREMDRMEERKRARRAANISALGLDTRARRKNGRR
jgi:small Trp-rich protein